MDRLKPAVTPRRLENLGVAMAALALCGVINKAHAGVSFACDASVANTTCATLNGAIAGLYGGAFSNAAASIFITYGSTGLGMSTTGFENQISYDTYRSDLIAEGATEAVRAAAIASLPSIEPAIYGGAKVDITSALGAALGITGLTGTTAAGVLCTVGGGGCYNGIITITNNSTLLYYRNGVESPNQYDYFTTVEHEVNEILGSSSCIGTQAPGLSDRCSGSGVSATDLFRYDANGNRVFISSAPGAQFSYDAGATNGANGFVYNTSANGQDYADYVSQCPAKLSVQSATGCPGVDHGLDITNDGGAEINTLNAVGFNRAAVSAAPEPGVWAMMFAGVGVMGGALRVGRSRRALEANSVPRVGTKLRMKVSLNPGPVGVTL